MSPHPQLVILSLDVYQRKTRVIEGNNLDTGTYSISHRDWESTQ